LLAGDDFNCEPSAFCFAPETTDSHSAARESDLRRCGQAQWRVEVRSIVLL
jgi:hypothetical protein